MRCKVCGAEYDLELDKCPYCNSENEIKTAQMMEEELDKYDKEAEEIYRSTHKDIHRGSRPTRKIIFAVVMLAGIFMLILISSFTSFLSKDKEKEKAKQDSNVKSI